MGKGWIRRLESWRYESSPESAGKRDLRLDLLRGFCLFVMTVDHVGGESSWLYAITGGDRFVVSAAEGFVLLCGLSMGMLHRITIEREGIRAMLAKTLSRAAMLYALGVALTLVFASVSLALAVPWAVRATPAAGEADFVFAVLALQRSYSLTDILLLYLFLMVAAGPALALLARGHARPLLAVSLALWAAAQVWGPELPRPWVIVDGGFPFSAWQLIFCAGLAVGYHRRALARHLRPSRLLVVGLASAMAIVVVRQLAVSVMGVDGAEQLLFDKNEVRPLRVVALFSVAALAYAAVTVGWLPLRRWSGWLLLTLGRRSLFAYSVQLFAVAFWASALMAPVRLDRENALFQASAVLVVWIACLATPRLAIRGPVASGARTAPLAAAA